MKPVALAPSPALNVPEMDGKYMPSQYLPLSHEELSVLHDRGRYTVNALRHKLGWPRPQLDRAVNSMVVAGMITWRGTDLVALRKLVSETGRWEMGFQPVMFGLWVIASRQGHETIALNYCAGERLQDQLLLFGVILRLLERLPKETTEAELRRLLPMENRTDPECLAALLTLAGLVGEQVSA